MKALPEPRNDYERKLLDNIERHGCQVTSVFDPDGDGPAFSYSVGIPLKFGAPEVIVVGLPIELGHRLVNTYRDRVRAGDRFVPRTPYQGFLEGFPVSFVVVAARHREQYLRSARWLHGGVAFDALQLVFPTKAGVWPWDPSAPEGFLKAQPLLDSEHDAPAP